MPIKLTDLERFLLAFSTSWLAGVLGAIGENFQHAEKSAGDAFIFWAALCFFLLLIKYSQYRGKKNSLRNYLEQEDDDALASEKIFEFNEFCDSYDHAQLVTKIAAVVGLFVFIWPFRFDVIDAEYMSRYYWYGIFVLTAGVVVLLLFRANAWLRAA